jgi:hypothetical protein
MIFRKEKKMKKIADRLWIATAKRNLDDSVKKGNKGWVVIDWGQGLNRRCIVNFSGKLREVGTDDVTLKMGVL